MTPPKPKGWVGFGASTRQYSAQKQRAMLDWAVKNLSSVLVVLAEETEQVNIQCLDAPAAEIRRQDLLQVRKWSEALAAGYPPGRVVIQNDREVIAESAEIRALLLEAAKVPASPTAPLPFPSADRGDYNAFSWVSFASRLGQDTAWVVPVHSPSANPLMADLLECNRNFGNRAVLHSGDELSLIGYALNEVAMILHIFLANDYRIKFGPMCENRYDGIVYKILGRNYPIPALDGLYSALETAASARREFGSVYFELADQNPGIVSKPLVV